MIVSSALVFLLFESVVLGDKCQPASNTTGKLHFRVSVLVNSPYVMQDEANVYSFASHQNTFTGFLIEVLNEIFTRMGATFEAYQVPDKGYGFVDPDSQIGVGVVGEVFHCRADLAAADLVGHTGRAKYIALTMPYQATGYGIMMPRATISTTQGVFALFDPFDVATWISILVACAVVALCLALIYFVSPYGAAAGQMTRATSQDAGPQLMPLNAAWWAFSTLVRQRPESMPFTSGRILIGGWFFVSLVFVMVYVANFAAFRIVGTEQTDLSQINNVANLVSQNTIDYGAQGWFADSIKGVESLDEHVLAIAGFVEQRKVSLEPVRKAADYIDSRPENQHNYDEGVAQVRSNKNFAFVDEYWRLRYSASLEPCNTRAIGRRFITRNLVFAIPKGMPYEGTINHHLLTMKLEGTLEKLERRWFNLGPCDNADVEKESMRGVGSNAQKLGMKEMGGVFILLAITTAFAFIFAALEKVFVDKASSE